MAESVWDYPRPPRIESSSRLVRVIHGGLVIAESTHSLRILETSHPPVYYIPQQDVAMQWMERSPRRESFCEFKGAASYWSLLLLAKHRPVRLSDVAWSYAHPSSQYAALKDHVAFYANRVDACFVDDEQVEPQPGDFYGGWITSHVTGPFKGARGTLGW